MLARILFLSLLSGTSYASAIDCVGRHENHEIEVKINKTHDAGMLKIHNQDFGLHCKTDHHGLDLLCHGSRATTVYTVKIHRVTHSRRLFEYKGHLERTIGGFAGSIHHDLGELHCAEWPEGSLE